MSTFLSFLSWSVWQIPVQRFLCCWNHFHSWVCTLPTGPGLFLWPGLGLGVDQMYKPVKTPHVLGGDVQQLWSLFFCLRNHGRVEAALISNASSQIAQMFWLELMSVIYGSAGSCRICNRKPELMSSVQLRTFSSSVVQTGKYSFMVDF